MKKSNIYFLAISLILISIVPGCKLDELVKKTKSSEIGIFWRGFEFEWDDRVHRVGRFGSWIEQGRSTGTYGLPKALSLMRSAQSGSDSDVGRYSTMYSIVRAHGVEFVPGSVTIDIHGSERSDIPFSELVTTHLTELDSLNPEHDVILNGFDLKSLASPKKLNKLTLDVHALRSFDDRVEFRVSGLLNMSCQSLECGFEERVAYEITVHYMVIRGNFNHSENDVATANYSYSSDSDAPDPSPGSITSGPINPSIDALSVLGLKGFDFDVRKDTDILRPDPAPHLYTWNMWLSASETRTRGSLFFGHRSDALNLPHDGNVTMRIRSNTLQFDDLFSIIHCTSGPTERTFPDSRGSDAEAVHGHYGAFDETSDVGCL